MFNKRRTDQTKDDLSNSFVQHFLICSDVKIVATFIAEKKANWNLVVSFDNSVAQRITLHLLFRQLLPQKTSKVVSTEY